jgi:FkbM family methyltransferase
MAQRVGPSGSVVAIEPSPAALRCLRASVDVNGYADRVTVIEAAAGSRDGEARFVTHRNSTNGGSGFVLADAERSVPDGHGCSWVPLVRIDSVVRRRPITLLKLDAEGSELNVLAGAAALLQQDRPLILAELDPFCLDRVSGVRPRDVIDFMARQGYSCHQLGAGTAGARIHDAHASATEPVVFLPAR